MFVYLEAVKDDGGMVPLLALAFDFTANPIEFRLRLGLFLAKQSEAPDDAQAVGYRLETPEGPKSVHGYYHAQPITSWAKSTRKLPADKLRLPTPRWLPQHWPAFPLDARTPVGLLLNLLGGLYGHQLRDALKGAPFAGQLAEDTKGLAFFD